MSSKRTIAIGDIHGDLASLDRLLSRLPELTSNDTVVFLGDYCDRGPDSRGVIHRIRALQDSAPFRVVALRGNHEDTWVRAYSTPHHAFLLHKNNGCLATWRSFNGLPPGPLDQTLYDRDLRSLLDVQSWFPRDVIKWMRGLPTWFEDELAIYVHAGLDLEDGAFLHPTHGREKPLLWSRELEFFRRYRGKRVVFGHTRTRDLPDDHLCPKTRATTDPEGIWRRGDLIGLDTGAGMGGALTAVSLPDLTVYSSR
jgi:serine/threonine protein phosphatase 1